MQYSPMSSSAGDVRLISPQPIAKAFCTRDQGQSSGYLISKAASMFNHNDPAGGYPPGTWDQSQFDAAVEDEEDLAVDEETPTEFDDNDSAMGLDSLPSSVMSVSSSVYDYRTENGRTYHRYKDGKYNAPNDEMENDRLDLQHNIFIRTFDNRLGTAPPNNPGTRVGRVLDVGTGTGIWAIDFADEHPEAEVYGVDLSAVQPALIPSNVYFEVDDIEERWIFSRPFDYIHSRMMTGSIRDWPTYLRNCYDNVSPGGYLELNDIDAIPTSDDASLTESSALMRSVRLWSRGLEALGSPFESFSRLIPVLAAIGFVDVSVRLYKWPTNPWPRDPKYKDIGAWNYENLAPNWEGLLVAALTRALGWTMEDVAALAEEARRDFADPNIHAYFRL